MKKAAFLDRDGVINHDKGYVHKIEDFVLMDNVIAALRILKNLGFDLIVVTNQSGIGRGYYRLEDVEHLHAHMQELLADEGCALSDILICPHAPEDNCECRKPKPGMINTAVSRHMLDLSASIIIGDKMTDIKAGLAGGLRRGFLVDPKVRHKLPEGFEHVSNVWQAASILGAEGRHKK